MRRIVCFLIVFLMFLEISSAFARKKDFYTVQDLKRIFTSAVRHKLYWIHGKFLLEKFSVEPEAFKIPKKATYRVMFFSTPKIGSTCALIRFFDSRGKRIATLRVWGYVEAEVPVVVALKPIRARTIIHEDDVGLRLRPLSRLPRDIIFKKAYVIGKEAKVSLRPGTIIRMSYVEMPVIVKRNQQVSIIAQDRYLVVRAKGKALENGRRGQVIRVMNVDSKKVIWAKVISPSEVEVTF